MHFNSQQKIYQVLRLAVAMCFIGHGAFGIITKEVWCNYFGVFGIGRQLSYQLMPVLGSFDILLGILMLAWPVKAVPAWLVFWGIVTALLRPLSGEPFAELIERAGNYGAPLSLLLLTGIPKSNKGWFKRIDPAMPLNAEALHHTATCLKFVVFFLFLGHGWLNIIEKKALLNQYASLGFYHPAQVAQVVGLAEIILAFLILVKPVRPIILVLFLWKMGSELFYPHYVLFEWIERGGSYGAILALWMISANRQAVKFFFRGNYNMQNA